MSFEKVRTFEKEIANFFGSPYGVAVDCCTHGLELCLRYKNVFSFTVPRYTYVSVPLLQPKLDVNMKWSNIKWKNYYHLTDDIIDAAVLWEKDSYIPDTFMCISFQFRKHMNLGRGGIILTDNKKAAEDLTMMAYDGRHPDKSWMDHDISMIGYHYYMTPETAELGLKKLPEKIKEAPNKVSWKDYIDVSKLKVFKNI